MTYTTENPWWEAGVLDGMRYVWWSRHRTYQAARSAARRYAKKNQPKGAHGAGAYDGYVRYGGGRIHAVGYAGDQPALGARVLSGYLSDLVTKLQKEKSSV